MKYIAYVLFELFYPVVLFFRAMFGRIWLSAKLPSGLKGVTICGDPEAISKEDFGRRLRWKWVLLRKIHPAYIYFTDSSGRSRKYARLVKEKWVLVRIGLEDVTFYALAPDGKEVPLMRVSSPCSRCDTEVFVKDWGEPIRWI